MIPHALSFGAVNTDRVIIAASAFMDDADPATWAGWVWMDNLTQTGSRIIAKGTSGANLAGLFPQTDTATGIQCKINRATTDTIVQADWANFAHASAARWMFLVGQTDTGTAANNRILVGNESTLPAEPSAYRVQQTGSGAIVTNAGTVTELGNQSGSNFPFVGDIAFLGGWKRLLSASEIRTLWLVSRQPRPVHPLIRSASGAWYPGLSGSGPVLDVTGRRSHGVVSGPRPVSVVVPGAAA